MTTNTNADNSVFSNELSDGTCNVSLLHVMKSAAGYYIGRYCVETDENSPEYMGGFEEPYSRESGYFAQRADAQNALVTGFKIRDCVENNYAYAQGKLSLTAK